LGRGDRRITSSRELLAKVSETLSQEQGIAQVVENMCEALGSIPCTRKKLNNKEEKIPPINGQMK
jgi:hypothetical protein